MIAPRDVPECNDMAKQTSPSPEMEAGDHGA